MNEEGCVNSRFFVDYVEKRALRGSAVLDFGCGDGTVVRLLADAGFDAYGVDIRWPGADYGDLEHDRQAPPGRLRYYDEGGPLPFADESFDVIISNQVLEHVVPLERTVAELERVARPGAVMYHHFPSQRVWREGHIGIPFAHRFAPGRARLHYTAMLRRAGLGAGRHDGSPRQWAMERLDWLDRWTVYRSIHVIEAVLGRRAQLAHREFEYCRFRAGDRKLLRVFLRPALRRPAEAVFRRLGFEAIEVRLR